MGSVYEYPFRVRTDECDSLGHVNNAVYIRHLQQATIDALASANEDTFWNARKVAIQYHAPVRYGDELRIATWVINADESLVVCGHEVTLRGKTAPVVSARIEWACQAYSAGRPRRVPESCIALAEAHVSAPLKPFLPPRDNGAHPFRWRHRVRLYELDVTDHVATAVYFNWLEEACVWAANVVGWPLDRMKNEDSITFQYRHDAEFFECASYGDEIEIVSRLISVKPIRGTWVHEAFRSETETLLMRDYSTGAFVDWKGKIKPAPAAMIEALVHGEVAHTNG